MKNAYWLFTWLDAHGITNAEDARRALSVPDQLEDLRQMAILANQLLPNSVSGGNVILAGRGLDLTSQLTCSSSSCRQRQVEELFRKAWHYFDSIVVDDAVSHEVTFHWDRVVTDHKKLLRQIEMLLYFRKIGAEDLVEFRQKPAPCIKSNHWRRHAHEAGLDSALEVADALLPQVLTEADIRVRPLRKGVSKYQFRHPHFEIVLEGEVNVGGLSGKPNATIRKTIAADILRRYFSHLTVDIKAAVSLGIPLGCTNWFHSRILSHESKPISISNVAFELNLPILDGIPVETLIKVRHDEQESFLRFRTALTKAMNERINSGSSTGTEQIAEQIRMEIIEPELQNIRGRLATAHKALAKKSAIGMFIGGLVTTCGILAGIPIPISIAAGIGTSASTQSSAAAKYIDDKQTVALSDMYFIWKAIRHADHEN